MTTIAMEEYELMKDSKYRMYVAAVDKALKNFEYTSEWADLISALGKLNKVLVSYTKFPVIPRRIKISKRLAQCMHPALPSGVHLKALETYDIIFRCMGTNRLSHELFIYSAGLFPLLGHAAMNIRPTLLTVYETHFVPLRERLRPALSGFLSGVLPGLETGSDHFERTNLLLENVCDGVGPAWFYTCIWQCVRNNSPIRLPAISFVLAHYSRKASMEDQLYLMGNDIDVMISGLCAAVQDSSVLVQRSALDLLMVCFPMHNTQLLYADMVRLVTAALSTILRRDMSLNRRLYSWLLSTEINNTQQSIQIDQNENSTKENSETNTHIIAYDLLNEAIRVILKQSSTEIPLDIKPYRLLTSLFDKPQIGPVILDNILYDVFRALYLSCLNQQKHKNASVRCVSFNGDLTSLKNCEDYILTETFLTKNCQELIKNANLLFNTLQSYYIWSYIEKLYKEAVENCTCYRKSARDRTQVNEIGSGSPNVLEICVLTDFLLNIIPMESYSENTSEILPNLFNKIVTILKQYMENLNRHEITQSLKLCTKILSKIQPITVLQPVNSEAVVPQDQEAPDSLNVDNALTDPNIIVETKEMKTGLEKSKSDSKINENLNKNELLTITNSSRERSNSNQMLKKKDKSSPKIEKKNKNKKSKSSSKLYDLKNESLEPEIVADKVEPIQSEPITEISTTQSNAKKIENKYFIKCLEEYKKFFISLIKTKILPGVDVKDFFKTLICDKDECTKNLEKLLNLCLNDDDLDENSLEAFRNMLSKMDCLSLFSSSLDFTPSEFDETLSVACNILLEFSSFPNILNSEPVVRKKKLPHWLETLIVCSCHQKSFRDVQITAMNTLLDIFSLAKSQNFDSQSLRSTNVVIMGILEKEYVSFIEDSTFVIEVMSQNLWDMLGNSTNQKQVMLCVTLLYQIHNIFDTKTFVEDVIAKYLVNETLRVEFFKRFALLWHLGRDLNIRLAAHQSKIRNFDRSLLKILDNLNNTKKPNLRLLSETFLTHSLLRNDIPRIINPILTKLLSPNTARISIKYVNIQDTDSQVEVTMQDCKTIEDTKAKISAVSGRDGNIKYHFIENPSPKSSKKKWFSFPKAIKNSHVIDMTTSITENSNIVTKKNKDFKNLEIAPTLEQNNKSNIKLFINPLSSKEIYPNGANGSYIKLDANSSNESLSSSNDLTQTSNDSSLKTFIPCSVSHNTDRDSGFESLPRKSQSEIINRITNLNKDILEHIEPISEGIKAERNNKLPKSQSFDEKSNNNTAIENLSLVHSWSYCVSDSDNLHAELEISTSAEDFFKGSDNAIVLEILHEIINKVCDTVEGKSEVDLKGRPADLDLKPKIEDHVSKNFVLYPMHYHICLYYEVFDSNQVLYALKTLKNCLLSNPQLLIRCLATSGLKDLQSNDILHLLARHRKSIFGGGFSGKLNQEHINFYRGYMFLDAVISICLNLTRSFYPSLDDPHLTFDEMKNNLKIQLTSLEILDIIIKNLIIIVNENSKGFASYIADMLIKCKLQKILLYCLLTSVRSFDDDMTFAEEVLLFNHFQLFDSNNLIGEHVEAFQIQLLRLIHSLIILEYHVFPLQENNTSVQSVGTPMTGEPSYIPTILIPQQQMFLSAIMSALRHQNMKSLHEKWCNMVTSCLPYFDENLKQIALSVIHQICNNIEEIANNYKSYELEGELCPDYAVTQLESLTILCHYCLLDSSHTVNQGNAPVSASTTSTNPGEIFNNLVNAFFSPAANDVNVSHKQNADYYQNARKTVLSHMPRIILSVAKLWQTIVNLDNDYYGIFGNLKVVKQQLLEFLSPIAVHHGASFLAAVAVTWYERRNPFTNVKTVLPEPNTSQNNLVYLISAIRVIPLDNLVQTVTAVIKNPPPTEGLSSDISLDVSLLELFYCYMRNASATQLSEAWGSLLTLIREGCSMNPPAQFLLAALLHELMIKCCPLEERKEQKDLQDVTAKLIECVSQVCGSCLEQTTWLRRNLAVKEQQDEDSNMTVAVVNGNCAEMLTGTNYSVQAQLVLSEILAPVLDICFGSQEKDKVNTILTSLMYNIVPYLRTHTLKNMASFQACSKLLASLSSYQYTRKAWKKDVFDLLLDNVLFQMDISSLRFWKVIVDNLMTHDTTTFRDLMSRVSLTQSGSLSIFSSREQEYEQRAQLLKRLAFVIFCSEMDQYAKYMPDIQEQLTSSLRLNVPGVQAQVFLCFRAILIRMSPMHVTSLWPIIISEMLQVFLQIEQELTTDTEEFSSHIKLLTNLDSSWATNSSNGLHALGHPHWLRLQLATAKLLDLALLLPATWLPQFQMYRWAFVGDNLTHVQSKNNQDSAYFTPHVIRIANLMDQKFADTQIETLPTKQNELLLTMNTITQLKDLHGFFKTLSLCSNRHRTECSGSVTNDMLNERHLDKKMNVILEKLDKVIEMDFLDKIPR